MSVAYLITKETQQKVGLPVPAEARPSKRVAVEGPVDDAEPVLLWGGRPRGAIDVGTFCACSAEPLRQVGGGLRSSVDRRLAPSAEAQRQVGVEVEGFGEGLVQLLRGGRVQFHHGGEAAPAVDG